MGEEAASDSEPSTKAWHSYISEDIPRNFKDSADAAIRSARSIQESTSSIGRNLFQEFIPQIGPTYRYYEEAFFNKAKDEVVYLRDNPPLAAGLAVACLFLMRGPRRFLLRQTLHRLQSEEARFVRAEKNVNELNLSVELMKKEGVKLFQRSMLAEKDMKHGYSSLMNAGTQIQTLAKSVYKAEAEAKDLMDLLRQIPGREAIKLRAEVASMASQLRQQRSAMDKRLLRISEFGVPV
ncbi:hypothetical protein M569_11194 [Genlisea aurea]|uniref:Uncharacterized protein n=1 Tax=Genlisea aurea TaxID=192259 RepID=S8DL51_9LAMI|nr:hypothetical protein M569_11194 [Genlisea aurea]